MVFSKSLQTLKPNFSTMERKRSALPEYFNPWRVCSSAHLMCVLFVTVSFFNTQAQTEMDVKGPCYGCRLFNLDHRWHPEKNKTDTKFCHYPCQCPYEELSCHDGVNIIKDGCGCCYACARQQGDLCNIRDRCDEKKGLYCDSEGRHATNTCKTKEVRRSCMYNGASYKDGEQFQPSCSQLCTCQNGFPGCVNLCPQEDVKPSEETCHNAVLIKVKNQCCREWKCQKTEANGSSMLARGLESHNLINPQWYQNQVSTTTTTPATTVSRAPEPCHLTDTDWSHCSATCDMGVSMKFVIDRATCTASQREKLCFLRPCDNTTIPIKSRRDNKCTPTSRSAYRVPIQYQDCTSYKSYNLKFCNTCKTNKCCWPVRTRTVEVKFRCSDRTTMIYEFLRIRKCRCDEECYVKSPRRRKGGFGRRVGRRSRNRGDRRLNRWQQIRERDHFDFTR